MNIDNYFLKFATKRLMSKGHCSFQLANRLRCFLCTRKEVLYR
jgi:hypothetical protein